MVAIKYKYSQGLAVLCGIIFCSLSLIKLQQKQLAQNVLTQDKNTYLKQEQYLQTAVKLQQKMPVFGFDNLFADWTYLQFIQYFGDTEARENTGYSVVTNYFENIVDRDPNFVQAHLVISSANSLFAAQPEKTVDLLNQVLATVTPEVPNYPFLLWTYKATDEILFLGNLGAAKNSYEMAAEWASMRNDDLGKELSSRYLDTAKFLASNPNSTDAQIGAWVNVLSQAQDLKTQQHVIKQLEELGAEVSITEAGEIKIIRPNKA